MRFTAVLDELLLLLQTTENSWRSSSDATGQTNRMPEELANRVSVHTQAADIVKEARAHLYNDYRRLRVANNRYIIATVGLGNVGKSTLLNALFGTSLAPAWNGPCTAFPIEFETNNEGEFTVAAKFGGSFQQQRTTVQTPQDVISVLDALTHTHTGTGALEKVTVTAPLPLLETGIVIADTPGFGAVQLEGEAQSHESALFDYLRRDVSQIFWVVSAERGGIGGREKAFYDQWLRTVCGDIVVTRAEDWDDQEKGRFTRRYSRELDSRFIRFHFASGKDGVAARLANDRDLLERSGVAALEKRIYDLACEEKRVDLLTRHVGDLVQDLVVWLCDHRKNHGPRSGTLNWHPIRWSNWQKLCVNQPDDEHLCRLNRELEKLERVH